MFSADITWSPLADDSATRKKEKKEADRNKDAESLESKSSRSSKRLRWPLFKKPERLRNTQSREDLSGSLFSSHLELPGNSTPSSPSHPISNEYDRSQGSSTHPRDILSTPKIRDQHGNQVIDSPGALPSVLEIFELPASTKVEASVQSALDHTMDLHQKHSSDISSPEILKSLRAPYLALSSGNRVTRSPSSTSPDAEKTYPR